MSDPRPHPDCTSLELEAEAPPTPEQMVTWREMQERYRAELAALRPPVTGCVDTSPFYRDWRRP